MIWLAIGLTAALVLWGSLDRPGMYAPSIGPLAAIFGIPAIWLMTIASWGLG